MQARVDGRMVYVGKPDWFLQMGVAVDGGSRDIQSLRTQGKTLIAVVVEAQLAGLIAVADSLKPGSKEAVEELHRLGLRVVMLTGDTMQAARTIAAEVLVDEIVAMLHELAQSVGPRREEKWPPDLSPENARMTDVESTETRPVAVREKTWASPIQPSRSSRWGQSVGTSRKFARCVHTMLR